MTEALHDLLDRRASDLPRRIAIVSDTSAVAYRDLAIESRRVATWLQGLGVRRGDRVAVLLPNVPELVAIIFACSRLAALFVVLHHDMRPFLLAHVAADCKPRVLLTTESRALDARLRQMTTVVTLKDYRRGAATCEAFTKPYPGITADPACLIYTSGSTSMPRGVISTHRNISFATGAIQSCLGMRADDVVGVFLPFAFDYGLYQVFLACQVGATLALGSGAQAGPPLIQKLKEWGVTGLPLVPSLAVILLQLASRARRVDLPSLRYITSTGEVLPTSVIDQLSETFVGCRVYSMFGLTECKRVSILAPEDHHTKPRSVGKPLPDTECFIVDPTGRRLPPGQPGELVVRGPHVTSGYWNAADLTDRKFPKWGQGLEHVLFTGDVCSLDIDGYLYFHGRGDDIYKSHGQRVSALEVEAAALAGCSGRQAVLIPPAAGCGATLFVTGEPDSNMVVQALRERLEEHKLPERIVFVDSLPLTSNGKLDRQTLRRRLLDPKS